MKDVFVALFTPRNNGSVRIRFPDYPECITSGKDWQDAFHMAEDAINLCIVEMEELRMELPTPQRVDQIEVPEGSFASLIPVDTSEYRKKTDSRAVRKNVSLPAWMVAKVEQMNINCSQVLQEALQERFAIQ